MSLLYKAAALIFFLLDFTLIKLSAPPFLCNTFSVIIPQQSRYCLILRSVLILHFTWPIIQPLTVAHCPSLKTLSSLFSQDIMLSWFSHSLVSQLCWSFLSHWPHDVRDVRASQGWILEPLLYLHFSFSETIKFCGFSYHIKSRHPSLDYGHNSPEFNCRHRHNFPLIIFTGVANIHSTWMYLMRTLIVLTTHSVPSAFLISVNDIWCFLFAQTKVLEHTLDSLILHIQYQQIWFYLESLLTALPAAILVPYTQFSM